ncbi:MAG: hotdog fold thioesterase [Chloroflexi bacterium]|nr:MAG: hotdog fold thioesterase [Chloroflexota bacterium]
MGQGDGPAPLQGHRRGGALRVGGGVENNTSFVRAVRSGTRLHAVATPLTRGRKSQLWEGRILDDQERLIAVGRVRLLCLPADDALAGEVPRVQR